MDSQSSTPSIGKIIVPTIIHIQSHDKYYLHIHIICNVVHNMVRVVLPHTCNVYRVTFSFLQLFHKLPILISNTLEVLLQHAVSV